MKETNEKQAWTQEPWIAEGGDATVAPYMRPYISGQGMMVAEMRSTYDAERAVACVNACAGIKNPEATIPALVAALDQSLVSLAALTDGETCDHAVGICWCGIHQEMADAREVLKQAKGGA